MAGNADPSSRPDGHSQAPHAALFFAASPDKDIDTALRLSGLRPGQRFLDLGSGDGRVLAAACDFGAEAVGIELDGALVGKARRFLDGRAATVEEADLFAVDLTRFRPDVVFAFLTHSLLQSLAGQIERLAAGTVLVTVGPAMPGWIPTRTEAGIATYVLPVERSRQPDQAGWLFPGIAGCLPPDRPMVTSFLTVHPAGPVAIRTGGGLDQVVTLRTGATLLDQTDVLGVDIYWPARPSGTHLEGSLHSDALGDLPVLCFYEADGVVGMTPFEVTERS